MGKVRVALLVGDATLSFRFSEALIDDLVRAGYEVDYLGPNVTARTAAAVRALGAEPVEAPLDRTGMDPVADVRFVAWFVRYLRKRRVEIVLSRQPKANILGMLGATLAGVRRRAAMVEGLGYAFTPGQATWKKRLLRIAQMLLYKLSFNGAHVVFFLNKDDMKELESMRLVHRERAFLLGPIGLSFEDWPEAPPHLDPFTFTQIARVLREKGVVEFAAAARIVHARHPRVRFRLVGPLDTNPGAIPESEVRRWVDEGALEWIPWTDDVPGVLRRTSVFVLPSYYREGVPRSTQEAMAVGRPVITTDVPGCRETVVDGVNGFLVPPRDPAALAAAMIRFIEEPDLVVRMGRESRRIAEQRFDVRKVNRKLIEALAL
jgi:glycosyltransferase involved in cell wall biosynthesis